MFGYHGRVLVVDLTARTSRWEPLSRDTLQAFIGGVGLGAFLLYRHCRPRTDPFDPANPLIFACAPLVGSRLTTSSKFAVVTRSPLTGFIGDSLSSSFMATELKKTGCDALVITGRSESPTLLHIDDGEVEFLDGGDLWGLTTSETEEVVKLRLGRRTRVACIGPAGERLVRFASISNDGGRHAGRTGPGAVMGSKNLKAIAVHGTKSVPVRDPEGLEAIGLDLSRRSLGPATEKYRKMGTVANVAVFNRLGTLPTLNFQQSTFEGAEQVGGEQFHQSHLVKSAHCANCTIGCAHVMVTNDDGPKAQGKIEYESAFALGPLVGVSDPNAVLRASRICDETGMDTISAGATVAWAIESFERGVLDPDVAAGFDLRFGDGEGLLACLSMISERRGIGDLLAEGSRIASRRVGRGSDAWAMHVKGLEMPGYEPRSLKTMALGLAVSTRGACHNRSSAYEADFSSRVDRLGVDDQRGRITAEGEDLSSIMDSLAWCKFLRKAFADLIEESADIYERVTGWSMTPGELRLAGERISTVKKLFNIREGWTAADDTLPHRTLTEKLPTGVVAGVGLTSEELGKMIGDYYAARGWAPDGLVPDEKIRELGLEDLVAEAVTVS